MSCEFETGVALGFHRSLRLPRCPLSDSVVTGRIISSRPLSYGFTCCQVRVFLDLVCSPYSVLARITERSGLFVVRRP
ncbi:uncharacterized protein P174DRAFT_170235 [Aspergillus novofumigatus IBT 16806]|uniref:Uncharacterized protein n=1 Tax=Aspergillus novofumigatus (strain IBT 16806) TaxID=1392255 RepID=A0A2I1C8W2_ASPN1|nr:uncharacterized protein P174DRAFT_170235 [Aspergillus novofumigatus IBT 16806]PKX94060.1 hypothetical protein P174DRAFT_170235 [Aspergillus novofumigatus IBT 16806]